jgi:hypothetical protein
MIERLVFRKGKCVTPGLTPFSLHRRSLFIGTLVAQPKNENTDA